MKCWTELLDGRINGSKLRRLQNQTSTKLPSHPLLILLNWKLTLVYFLQWIKTLIYRDMSIPFAKMSPHGFFLHLDSTRYTPRRDFHSWTGTFFCDPNSVNQGHERGREKLAKVKPFLEHLQAACKANFNCGKNITIDQDMVPYEGKLSIKQQILGKPVRWGIKLFPLWILKQPIFQGLKFTSERQETMRISQPLEKEEQSLHI